MPRPQPELIFFLDNCLGTSIVPGALRDGGMRVEILRDHFPEDSPDDLWLGEIGRRGWVVLTKDKRIRHRELERQTLVRAGVAVFVLTAGEMLFRGCKSSPVVSGGRSSRRLRLVEPCG